MISLNKRASSAKTERPVTPSRIQVKKSATREREIFAAYSSSAFMHRSPVTRSPVRKMLVGEGMNTQPSYERLLEMKLSPFQLPEAELSAQNNFLKHRLKEVEAELEIKESKINRLKSKDKKKNETASEEYEKELYWRGSNQNMVAGIKAQYQRMKDANDVLQNQIDTLRKDATATKIKELETICNTLIGENILLNKQLEIHSQDNKQTFSTASSKTLKAKSTTESNTEVKLKSEIAETNELNRQLEKKIEFLERLIIEKGNNEHASYRKWLKAKQEIEELKRTLKEKTEMEIEQNKRHEEILQQIKKVHREEVDEINEQVRNQMIMKDALIVKLTEEAAYYADMLRNQSLRPEEPDAFEPYPITESKYIDSARAKRQNG